MWVPSGLAALAVALCLRLSYVWDLTCAAHLSANVVGGRVCNCAVCLPCQGPNQCSPAIGQPAISVEWRVEDVYPLALLLLSRPA